MDFFCKKDLIKSDLFVEYAGLCLVNAVIKINCGADKLVSQYWWESKLTADSVKGRTQLWLLGAEPAGGTQAAF